jgi:hypothetical protein
MIILLTANCEKIITDYGNDRSISGILKDPSGIVVPGDITSTNLSVKALGEGDIVTTDMRVHGDGTYSHTKLYPKKYKIYVTGPITMVDDTLNVDFSIDKSVIKDIVVTPFLSLTKPAVVGSPTATTIDVSYAITASSGKTVSKRALYCSTVPYPNASTGSGPFYATKTVTLNTDSGNASVTGLTSKTKYFIRIGAQATGATGFNYSDQIEITTL